MHTRTEGGGGLYAARSCVRRYIEERTNHANQQHRRHGNVTHSARLIRAMGFIRRVASKLETLSLRGTPDLFRVRVERKRKGGKNINIFRMIRIRQFSRDFIE